MLLQVCGFLGLLALGRVRSDLAFVSDIVPHRIGNFLALAFNLSSVSQDSMKEQIR